VICGDGIDRLIFVIDGHALKVRFQSTGCHGCEIKRYVIVVVVKDVASLSDRIG